MIERPPVREGKLSRHILALQEMAPEEIRLVLESAASIREILDRPIKKVPTLRGKSICTLFYEPSTRTRASFELAAKIMSADAINISTSASAPFVNLQCSQNGATVMVGTKGYFVGSLDTNWNFGLASGVWQGGAASCVAYVQVQNSHGGWTRLGSTTFAVGA